MKIAILYNSKNVQPAETKFKEEFSRLGAAADLVDVMQTSLAELSNYNLVFNRVYARDGVDDQRIILQTLTLLKEMERQGVPCINGYDGSLAGYSKMFATTLMDRAGVATPATLQPTSIRQALAFAEDFGYPLVVKRDMGGYALDVNQAKDEKELVARVETAEREGWGSIVQEFVQTTRPYDARIAIIGGELASAYSRGLFSRNGEAPWIGSISNGSKKKVYTPSDDEVDLAERATLAIGAFMNEVDIVFGPDGPIIIENNPTSAYTKDDDAVAAVARKVVQSVPMLAQRSLDEIVDAA